jgi:hypothetical protein
VNNLSTATPFVTEKDIENCVNEYLQHSLPIRQRITNLQLNEENMSCNLFDQEKLLIIWHYKLEELPVSILRRLPIYLVREFVVQVEFDSVWFWALTHDIVNYSRFLCSLKDWKLLGNFKALMAAHFANLNLHAFDVPSIERLDRAVDDIVPQPVKDLVDSKGIFLMYICYPVLESLAKFVLSPIIDRDGNPQASFTVKDNGQVHNYKKGSYKINSLAIILRALEENGSNILLKPEFSDNLRDFRLEVEKIIPPASKNKDGWNSIYDLRNASLHGVIDWQRRSGLLTNLICLILWNFIGEKNAIEGLERLSKRHMHFPSHYYPPEF